MELILLLVLLALSALFSGSETAFFSLGAAETARLKQEGPSGRGVVNLLRRSGDLLSALLIGNLLVNTGASVVATGLCLHWFGARGVAVAIPALTLLLLLFGEITPKMLALRNRRRLARLMQAPMRGWLWLIGPILRVIGAAMEALLRAVPWERSGSRSLTTLELQAACDLAVEEGTLTETEGRSLARLLQLESLEVQHIMTPRTSVVSLRRDMNLVHLLAVARRAGFNRFPVLSEDGRRPEGLFHLKDLLGGEAATQPLQTGPLRPLIFVPESKDVAALLAEMRGGGAHLAAVVDEHGDFTGIVTMADCLQALMGPVADSASHSPDIISMGNGSWVISGGTDLRELEEACGLSLPPSRDYVTIAGFMMTFLGRVLEPGDAIVLPRADLVVLEMTNHRVDRIRVALHSGPEENIASGERP